MTTDLIDHNPLLKKPLLTMLSLCESHPDAERRTLEQLALDQWSDEYRQSHATTLDILVRNDALSEQVYVDGEPYDGTLEDAQTDAAVADDAVAESRIAITSIGRELLDAYAADKTLRDLIAGKPHYLKVYTTILETCNAEAGASRTDLEQAVSALPALQPDTETQRTRVYPQYFIDALESAGGIVWQGAWHTTDAGKALIAA